MRRLALIGTFLALSFGAQADERHESYISYDSGETRVATWDDREIEVGVNSPVLAGDRLYTSRSGRVEVRLADGNVVAVDRRSVLSVVSVSQSYEQKAEETVLRLESGKAIVQEVSRSSNGVRIDTPYATYASLGESIFSVETGRNSDSVAVFGGSVAVRTPGGSWELRTGERVAVDERGIFDESGLARDGMDSFERWYLRRTDNYRSRGHRYLDSRISYAGPVLDSYGRWVYVHDYSSWVWRPHVSTGWQPYRDGYWRRGRSGRLIWVSSEPWGWVPYHYGRWAFTGGYGWVWLPASSYSPAWVYWLHSPSFVAWIPWGYYDCFPPYYGWLHRPRHYIRYGFGFWGKVDVHAADLRHWTVVSPDHLVSKRIDRAALTTDAIRDRLRRDGNRAIMTDRQVTLSDKDLRNPSEAFDRIVRRGGEGTGIERSGSVTDATRFFRRDPELSESDRKRITRAVYSDENVDSREVVRSRTAPRGSRTIGDTPGTVTTRGTPSSDDRRTRTVVPRRTSPGSDRPVTRRGGTDGQVDRGRVPTERPEPRTSDREEVPGRVIDSIDRANRSAIVPRAPSRDTRTNQDWRRGNSTRARDVVSSPRPAAPSTDSSRDIEPRRDTGSDRGISRRSGSSDRKPDVDRTPSRRDTSTRERSRSSTRRDATQPSRVKPQSTERRSTRRSSSPDRSGASSSDRSPRTRSSSPDRSSRSRVSTPRTRSSSGASRSSSRSRSASRSSASSSRSKASSSRSSRSSSRSRASRPSRSKRSNPDHY